MVDPMDWLPLLGVALLSVTTIGSIAGAYAVGRFQRRERDERPRVDHAERERLDRLERMVETMAEEMERIGEGQRFLLKTMEKQSPRDLLRNSGRIITPH